MKLAMGGHDRAARGFTLVELLLVMGIIIMLVGLLFPAVTAAVTAVRVASTETTIKNLSAGLETFKQDWGIYPPSSKDRDGCQLNNGYDALIYYLAGPDGTGWGTLYHVGTGGNAPFGGSASAPYGPYYKTSGRSVDPITDQPIPPDSVQDAFKPGKVIYYYRYEPADTNAFDRAHNNASGADVLVGNFPDATKFEFLVKPYDPVAKQKRWVRQDFLLISAGADRYWGYVKEATSGTTLGLTQEVTQIDIDSGVATCDDICNFRHW
jgi:type II secretory pathway pseudopilin PulG